MRAWREAKDKKIMKEINLRSVWEVTEHFAHTKTDHVGHRRWCEGKEAAQKTIRVAKGSVIKAESEDL